MMAEDVVSDCVCLVAVMGEGGWKEFVMLAVGVSRGRFSFPSGLTWVMFIVTVEMSSLLPHSSSTD